MRTELSDKAIRRRVDKTLILHLRSVMTGSEDGDPVQAAALLQALLASKNSRA